MIRCEDHPLSNEFPLTDLFYLCTFCVVSDLRVWDIYRKGQTGGGNDTLDNPARIAERPREPPKLADHRRMIPNRRVP